MEAIIMAGGVGSRLRPLTNDIPKPMVKMIDKPVLFYIIELLKRHNFLDIGITLNYKPKSIIDYFGDGKDMGVKLSYFIEDKPLGTAGSVKNASKFLEDNFLVISGDAFTEINLSALWGEHIKYNPIATIAVKEVDDATGFGVVKIDDGIITDFIEKPLNPKQKTVNTGIYMFNKKIFDFISDGFCDFGKDVLPNLKGKMRAFMTDDYWSDIGTLSRYYSTNLYIADNIEKYTYKQ